jgi:hypothetical protein
MPDDNRPRRAPSPYGLAPGDDRPTARPEPSRRALFRLTVTSTPRQRSHGACQPPRFRRPAHHARVGAGGQEHRLTLDGDQSRCDPRREVPAKVGEAVDNLTVAYGSATPDELARYFRDESGHVHLLL